MSDLIPPMLEQDECWGQEGCIRPADRGFGFGGFTFLRGIVKWGG